MEDLLFIASEAKLLLWSHIGLEVNQHGPDAL